MVLLLHLKQSALCSAKNRRTHNGLLSAPLLARCAVRASFAMQVMGIRPSHQRPSNTYTRKTRHFPWAAKTSGTKGAVKR